MKEEKIPMQSFEYDKEVDSLSLYPDTNKKVEGCLVFDNLTFDVSEDGEIVGLEVDNASRFLEIKPEELSTIKEAEIKVKKAKNALMLGIKISLSQKTYNFSYALPKKLIN